MNAQISGSVNSAVDEHQSHVQVPDIYASQISVIIERFSKVTLLYWIDEIERREYHLLSLLLVMLTFNRSGNFEQA